MARLAAILLTAALLLVLVPGLHQAQEKAADVPPAPAGTWKVTMPFLGDDGGQPRWLVKFSEKDGKWSGELLGVAERWPKTTLEKVEVGSGKLRFQLKSSALTLPCEIRIPRDPQVEKLFGSAQVRKQPTPVELERTGLKSLESYDQLREKIARQPLGYEAMQTAMRLLNQSESRKAAPAEVRAWGEKAVKSAELYGPAWHRNILLVVSQILSEEKGFEAIALTYARRAERMLEPKEPPLAQKRVYDVLIGVLEKGGKEREKEIKEVQARVAKLDTRLKPRSFAGRKAKSDRAVLVELFTGAQCPPCVAADLAFDALGKSFQPSEVILLQYHLHIPGPDPLTSPGSEARAVFYGDEAIRGTPAILFNGRPGASGGGGRDDALEKFEEYVDVIEPLLDTPAKASVKVAVTRKGGKLAISAKVSELEATGEDVRLRLVLVEEEVAYKGSNGLPVHHHVVRFMPGGADGVVLKDKTLERNFEVDLEDVKKKLTEYLDRYADKRPFPTKDRPLELKKLKVIAFVQNDRGGEVLQAAQADVPVE